MSATEPCQLSPSTPIGAKTGARARPETSMTEALGAGSSAVFSAKGLGTTILSQTARTKTMRAITLPARKRKWRRRSQADLRTVETRGMW